MLAIAAALFLAGYPRGGASAQTDSQVAAEAGARLTVSTVGAVGSAGSDGQADDPEFGDLPPEILDPATDARTISVFLIPLTGADLAKVAEVWRGFLRENTLALIRTQLVLDSERVEDRAETRQHFMRLADEHTDLMRRYMDIVDAWEEKGGDPEAIANHRTYRRALAVEGIERVEPGLVVSVIWAWLISPEGGIAIATRVAIIVAAIFGLAIFARFVRMFVRGRIHRVPRISNLLRAFLVASVYWVVLVVGLTLMIGTLGFNLTPLLALFGGASVIIGFALHDTLGNLANGLIILITRPFDKGDFVDVGGKAGTVKSVSIVATTIATPDNQVIVIPNRLVWGDAIINVNASDTRRLDLSFDIAYDDSIPKALAILRDAVEAHPKTLDLPEPTIVVGQLAESSVRILCRPWVRTADYWPVHADLIVDVKRRFDEAGITIPYPQRDLHLVGTPLLKSAE
jgi:small conductance mechanosensitive channel